MFNIKNLFVAFASLIMMTAACKKESEVYTVKSDASVTGLAASNSNIVLTESAENDTVARFSWAASDFGNNNPVTYTLQLSTPADTAGGWAKAKSYIVESNELKYGFTGKALNGILLGMEMPGETAADVVFRVKAEVKQFNGSTSTIPPVFSVPVKIKVTPYSGDVVYSSFLWVPGNYQGWNPGAAPKLVSVKSDKIFEGYVDLQAGEFKLTAQPNWEPMAYGDGGDEKLIEANYAGGNFNASSSGYYFLYANLNTMKYKFIKTAWGVIGDATPGGWDNDTDLTYDSNTKKWSVTLVLKAAGSFKFRANDAWQMAMGVKDGKLAYSDNPAYPYDDKVGTYSVAENGTYTITLDFSNPGNYKYKIVKK